MTAAGTTASTDGQPVRRLPSSDDLQRAMASLWRRLTWLTFLSAVVYGGIGVLAVLMDVANGAARFDYTGLMTLELGRAAAALAVLGTIVVAVQVAVRGVSSEQLSTPEAEARLLGLAVIGAMSALMAAIVGIAALMHGGPVNTDLLARLTMALAGITLFCIADDSVRALRSGLRGRVYDRWDADTRRASAERRASARRQWPAPAGSRWALLRRLAIEVPVDCAWVTLPVLGALSIAATLTRPGDGLSTRGAVELSVIIGAALLGYQIAAAAAVYGMGLPSAALLAVHLSAVALLPLSFALSFSTRIDSWWGRATTVVVGVAGVAVSSCSLVVGSWWSERRVVGLPPGASVRTLVAWLLRAPVAARAVPGPGARTSRATRLVAWLRQQHALHLGSSGGPAAQSRAGVPSLVGRGEAQDG